MKKGKILYLFPLSALLISGCSFAELKHSIGESWVGEHILHPVYDPIRDLVNGETNENPGGKQDEPGTPAHTHSLSELHAGVAPTCTSEGSAAYYTCSGCDKIFDENKEEISEVQILPALGHAPHHHEGTPANCTKSGTGEYWTCDNACDDKMYSDEDCKNVISTVPVVEALGHKLEAKPGKAASCTEDGYESYYECHDCHALFEDEAGKKAIADLAVWKTGAGKVEMTAHTIVPVAGKQASCIEDGYESYYECSVCHKLFEDEAATQEITNLDAWKAGDGKIPMGEHGYGTPTVEWKGNSATATAQCTGCTDKISETKIGTFVEDTAATCHSAQLGHYEVTFDDTRLGSASTEANSATGDPATGEHVYGTPSVEWNGSSATATAKCTAEGCDAQISETKVASFVEDSAVSCCADQLGHYEVTFNDTRLGSASTEANGIKGESATGNHDFDYANKTITWNGDEATATAKCSNSACEAVASETKKGTFVSDTASTCTAPEKGHFEVTFNNTNFGSAQTAANSIDNGEPHAHTYGTLIPEVPALRGEAGTKAYYKCSECGGYFNSSYESITANDLTIAAPAKHFDANTDMNFDFGAPIPLTQTIIIDVKLENPTSESKVNFALFGLKDDGGSDWDNYLGYFAVRKAGSDNYAGVSTETITDDGYFRIKIDLSQVTRVGNVNGNTPSFTAINGFYVRGAWTDVSGYVDVNSTVNAHTKGATLIPAKAAGPHGGEDGYQAHYECTGCDDYWFNESGALCKKEDLIIASKAIKYAPPTEGKTMAEFRNLGNLTDKFWIDIHFDNPTKHQELGFNFYESAWDNYYGIFWVDCDEKGVRFEGDYNGLELVELEDGWWRLNVYPAALNKFVKDKEIDQKRSIDFIYVQGPNTVSNRGSGMMEFMPDYDKVLPSTKVYSLSGKDSYTTERIFSRGDKINLDIQIKNDSQANIVLMQYWSTVVKFNVTAAGTILDQTNGVQIFKLNNEAEGYPTLSGTWYRIMIDLAYAKIESGMEGYTYIDRIGGNNWNAANFDMMIGSPYTTDGWYTIAGGSSNNKINFKIPTPLAIRDGDGQLLDKALYFEVKAVGTGKAYVSPMDYDWHNCGKYVLTFTDGVLTDRVVQGSANKWPKVTDLGNGVYGLTLALSQLPGDGLASASSIGFFYNGEGVLADGLSEFSINVFSLKLVEIPA